MTDTETPLSFVAAAENPPSNNSVPVALYSNAPVEVKVEDNLKACDAAPAAPDANPAVAATNVVRPACNTTPTGKRTGIAVGTSSQPETFQEGFSTQTPNGEEEEENDASPIADNFNSP